MPNRHSSLRQPADPSTLKPQGGTVQTSQGRKTTLILRVLATLLLLATTLITTQAASPPSADAQTGQSLQTPIDPSDTFCVGQGYKSGPGWSHANDYGLDLALSGPGACSYSTPGSTGKKVYAPVTGTISWVEHDTGTGTICINFDSTGDGQHDSSIDVTHIDIVTTLNATNSISANTYIGTVAGADSTLDNIGVWNNNTPHIHLSVWTAVGCPYEKDANNVYINSKQTPFTGKYEMCGAPDPSGV